MVVYDERAIAALAERWSNLRRRPGEKLMIFSEVPAMTWKKPSLREIWDAIEIYLRDAYEGRSPPPAVTSKIETLRSLSAEAFFESEALERGPGSEPPAYSLRLGNKLYPHMKLVIERAPDGEGFFFRADTHDRHCCPEPGAPEHEAFCELMARNQRIAEAVESSWEREDVPTFKAYLRQDLARRRSTVDGRHPAAR